MQRRNKGEDGRKHPNLTVTLTEAKLGYTTLGASEAVINTVGEAPKQNLC